MGHGSDKCRQLWTWKCAESTDAEGKAAGETPCPSPLQISLHQSRETQTMPETHGNVSEEILLEMCNTAPRNFHLPSAIGVITEECWWPPCLICE